MKWFAIFSLSLSLFLCAISLPQSSFVSAIDFDGYGDYANTFNSPYFPTENGSLEAWVKVRAIVPPDNTLDLGDAFISKNEEQWNQGDFYFFFWFSNGKLTARIQNYPSHQNDIFSNTSFFQHLDVWIHVAFSWGTDGMKMYIDGVLQNDQNSITYSALNNSYNFYVGCNGYMLHNGTYVISDYFDGQIDELRIWNYQKTSEQILALWNSPLDSSYFVTSDSGLVGYWRFDELEDLGINNDGPDDVRDFSVLQNHLDLSGDAHLVPFTQLTTSIFEKTYGGLGDEKGVVIDKTTDGGFVIGGSTGGFSSSEDMYLVKLDSTGSIQWTKVYNSFGYDRIHGIKQTADGGYYISGYVGDGYGLFDMAIAKVDNIGNIVWSKSSGSVQAEEFRKLSLTADGGFLVAGYNASLGAGAKDVQAMKLSGNGDIEWAKTYGTWYEDFNSSCIVASDGNYVLAGAVDISGSYDIRPTLIKLDTLGNIIWAKYYSGYIEDWGRDLIETPDGGYLLSGDTRSYGYGGSRDIFLIKTDISGNVEWGRAYGGSGNELAYCVIMTSDLKFIISGSTSSFGFGGSDAFLMKVDLNGSAEWFHTYGGYTNDYAHDVIEAPDYGFVLTGRRSSNTLGGDDVYLVKTDANGYSYCAFGTFNPNVFSISNLEAINLNISTLDFISATNFTFTTITPNSAENTSCAIIPVELKSFLYELEDNKVLLKWSTATETNNMGFEIYRDEKEIGFVEGHGTTTEEQEYLFIDTNVPSGTYFYSLIQIDFDGTTENVGEIEVVVDNTPTEYSLTQNYPNPFNPTTNIKYTLPQDSYVVLNVYDVLGNKVTTLVNSHQQAGAYNVVFDGSNLSSGIYFYHLKAGEFTAIKKLLLLK
jgi:hypothetical protein